MMPLLAACAPDSLLAAARLLDELALLPSKHRVGQRNPLNLGYKVVDAVIEAVGRYHNCGMRDADNPS